MSTRDDADAAAMGFRSSQEVNDWQRAAVEAAKPAPASLTRGDLRNLVDHVWQCAFEDRSVPGTPEADRMIDHALGDDVFTPAKPAPEAVEPLRAELAERIKDLAYQMSGEDVAAAVMDRPPSRQVLDQAKETAREFEAAVDALAALSHSAPETAPVEAK